MCQGGACCMGVSIVCVPMELVVWEGVGIACVPVELVVWESV